MPVWVIKYLLPAVVVAVIAGGAIWWFNNKLETAYDNGKTAGLTEAKKTCDNVTVPEAKAEVQAQCDANLKIATEATNALQNRYSAIDARYNRMLRDARSRECVPIAAHLGGVDASSGGSEPAGSSRGVAWIDLYDNARDNDKTSARLSTLQEVICGIYKNNRRLDLLPAGACQ